VTRQKFQDLPRPSDAQGLMVDLFCGRGGWTKGFLAQGWRVRGYDLNPQPDYPKEAEFVQADILTLTAADLADADFICCSSPCEEFSVHCMKHFHPNPKFPEMGIKLFNHAREMCEESGKPYVMENVRCAERFVGRSVNHCGPFYLWGTGVPAIMPAALYKVQKGLNMGNSLYFGGSQELLRKYTIEEVRLIRREHRKKHAYLWTSSKSQARKDLTEKAAEIPQELSTYLAQTVAAGRSEVNP
jgi:hypothetical protein